MPQGSSFYLIMIVFIVLIGIMMWWQSRKAKQQQQKMKDFRSSLEPGTEVITIGGIIGKVVSVDEEYEEIVIDSEGSLLRFTFRAINKEYTRPAFIHDDEVEDAEQTDEADDQAQVPVDKALESAENATQSDDSAQTADAEK